MGEHQKTVVFFHPDLGIGGAERLVVDAAVGLQKRGNKVVIFTSHCDPTHCFEEARDGTLDVRVYGNSIVPPSIVNRFAILCAILRQLHLVIQISLLSSELANLKPDVFFIDQLSACVPLLRIRHSQVPVLFYCHFPDKLLAYREGLLKKIYRIPFDWWESWSTGCSSTIVVNSNFTKGVFAQAFPSLSNRAPEVVYPCVDISDEAFVKEKHPSEPNDLWRNKKVLLSINRFERKKDIGLAIRAFAGLNPEVRSSARLVAAGGYDVRVNENVTYHQELESLAESLGLKSATAKSLVSALSIPEDIDVLFLLSVPTSLKQTLLKAASLLIYTPKFEHFGIVPLEAMLVRLPVLAAQTGGPKETVVEGKTGWLRNHDEAQEWTEVLNLVLSRISYNELREIGENGNKRVVEQFSQNSMASKLAEVIQRTRVDNGPNVMIQMMITGGLVVAMVAVVVGTYTAFH